MADKIEPVAFTCPHDPDSSSAFAWPGTARCSTSHTTPLYSQQQLDALVASEQEALDDTAKWHRIAMDMMERAERAEDEAAALREALLNLLPFAEHEDRCGDHDAYNGAQVPTCDCGLDAIRAAADAALDAARGK